jgi:thiamine-monophosphate kinase
MDEFSLIQRYFAPLAQTHSGAFNLTDDAAVFAPHWVVTTDTIVEGVHFFAGTPPAWIAKKLLRTNLSDLAAKGAKPRYYTLALTLPRGTDSAWVEAFAAGLAEDQKYFGITLIGGDTTATDHRLVATITALGESPHIIRRNGAQVGDLVCVSGTIGDAALGLRAIEEGRHDQYPFLLSRYHFPEPRLALGLALRDRASASADISDGLIADAGHIATASGVGMILEAEKIPLSPESQSWLASEPEIVKTILTGGDDYELVFTLPPHIVQDWPTPVTIIGRCVEGSNVIVLDAHGQPIALQKKGYSHG